MAQFAKPSFSSASYAAFRPTYPPALYDTISKYHRGPKRLCVDLGCGHGPMARVFATDYRFAKVIGCDPSSNMIHQARRELARDKLSNLEFVESPAEHLPFLQDGSVDLVVVGQAAHWFDPPRFWAEMKRIILPEGGTLAVWAYKDQVFVDHPEATKILNDYTYGTSGRGLGKYWEPGRFKVREKLRSLQPPRTEWDDIERIEYEPGTSGAGSGSGTMFLNKEMRIEDCMEYVRTWSAFSAWQDDHPKDIAQARGGPGDIVDEMFAAMRKGEQSWSSDPRWKEKIVKIEWGSALILARRKSST